MNDALQQIPLPNIDYQPIGRYPGPHTAPIDQVVVSEDGRPAPSPDRGVEPDRDAKVAPQPQSFAQELRDRWPPKRSREEIQEVAAQFVATVFYQPLFQMMRDDPFRSELFHGGHGERVFEGQLHAEMAERMAKAESLPLVDAITDRLWQQTQPAGHKEVRVP